MKYVVEDESTSRYPAYGVSDDRIKLPSRDEYGRYSSHAVEGDLEDDVRVPGEEDVVSNFDFQETVIASCPICGGEMRAKLLEKGSNGLIGDMKITLHVVSRLCECPEVYLRYDN